MNRLQSGATAQREVRPPDSTIRYWLPASSTLISFGVNLAAQADRTSRSVLIEARAFGTAKRMASPCTAANSAGDLTRSVPPRVTEFSIPISPTANGFPNSLNSMVDSVAGRGVCENLSISVPTTTILLPERAINGNTNVEPWEIDF